MATDKTALHPGTITPYGYNQSAVVLLTNTVLYKNATMMEDMTSNNTPTPYVISNDSNSDTAYYPFGSSYIGAIQLNSTNYLQIDMGSTDKNIIGFDYNMMYSSNYGDVSNVNIEASVDGNEWDLICNCNYTGGITGTYGHYVEYIFDNAVTGYRYYRFIDTNDYGHNYSIIKFYFEKIPAIPNGNYLLQTSTGYLSLQDAQYDSDNHKYNELSSDTPTSNLINYAFDISYLTQEVTIGEETFKPIDKVEVPFKIINTNSKNFNTNIIGMVGLPQLLITDNISLTSYDIINSISVTNTLSSDSTIKLIFSIDNGTTWKTYKDNAITNIDITIPDSNYSSDNKTIWDNAITSIETNGILSTDISSILFADLTIESIKFAIVMIPGETASKLDCVLTDISVNYTKLTKYSKMNKSEYSLNISSNRIKVKSNISADKIAINIGSK